MGKRTCSTCGERINRGPGHYAFCSEECRPQCSAPQCSRLVRGYGPYCGAHRVQFAQWGTVKPLQGAAIDGGCVVCGAPRKSGRRKYCGDACKAADSRNGQTPRQLTAVCQLCGIEFSLGRRKLDGRLQRIDTKWCRTCGRSSPEGNRFRRYGITSEQYEAAVLRGCAICGRTDRKLHVDHDHSCCPARKSRTCGRCIRGLICGQCNRAIGGFDDDIDVIKNAVKYLEGHFGLP